MSLYKHKIHPHSPENVNVKHRVEQSLQGINTRIAVMLTRWVGSMECAYVFTLIAFVGLLGLLGLLNSFVFLLMQWVSQQFLQLVLLSVIMVGQGVLGRKAELQAEEQFNTTMKTYHDIEQLVEHLHKQDEELLEHRDLLLQLVNRSSNP